MEEEEKVEEGEEEREGGGKKEGLGEWEWERMVDVVENEEWEGRGGESGGRGVRVGVSAM